MKWKIDGRWSVNWDAYPAHDGDEGRARPVAAQAADDVVAEAADERRDPAPDRLPHAAVPNGAAIEVNGTRASYDAAPAASKGVEVRFPAVKNLIARDARLGRREGH